MKALLRSFHYAFRGIGLAFSAERNIKIGLICTAVVIALGFLRHVSGDKWAILLICCGAVLALEMVNTAIETVVNLVTEEFHELAKRAKDIAAGAVVLFSAVSAVVAVLVLFL